MRSLGGLGAVVYSKAKLCQGEESERRNYRRLR